MGPKDRSKSPGKKAGKSGKKKGKAEKERRRREEDEKRVRDAEEQMRHDAEAEMERQVREKQEAEAWKKRENEERGIRKALMNELDEIIAQHKRTLSEHRLNIYKENKWNRYMQCDGSPDPTVLSEINTYINLRMEDRFSDDVDSVLKATQLDLSLIDELEYAMQHGPEEIVTEGVKEQFKETISDLQKLIRRKLDMASYSVMVTASECSDPETSNLHFHRQEDKVNLNIWGNLAKNPRIKTFEFHEQLVTFDIPRILTLTDCAYRFLWCSFDHYSPQCRTFQPRLKAKVSEGFVRYVKT